MRVFTCSVLVPIHKIRKNYSSRTWFARIWRTSLSLTLSPACVLKLRHSLFINCQSNTDWARTQTRAGKLPLVCAHTISVEWLTLWRAYMCMYAAVHVIVYIIHYSPVALEVPVRRHYVQICAQIFWHRFVWAPNIHTVRAHASHVWRQLNSRHTTIN